MAQIPMGNFGNRGPDPVQHTRISDEGQHAVYDAQRNLLNVGVGILQRRDDEKKQLDQLSATEEQLKRDLNSRDNLAKLEQDAREGVLTSAQVFDEFEKMSGTMYGEPEDYKNWHPMVQRGFDMGNQKTLRDTGLKVEDIVYRTQKVEKTNSINAVLEQAKKNASFINSPEEMNKFLSFIESDDMKKILISTYGPNASKVLSDVKNDSSIMSLNYQIEGAPDFNALDAIEGSIGRYAMDGETTQKAYMSINRKRTQMQKALEQEQKEKDNAAKSMVGEMSDNVNSGLPIDERQWTDFEGITKGGKYEQDFKDLRWKYDKAMALEAMPPAQQAIELNKLMVQLKNTPTNRASKNKEFLDFWERRKEESNKLYQEDPLLYADRQTGKKPNLVDFNALLSNPISVAQTLQSRANKGSAMFYKDELNIAKEIMPKMNNDQKLGLYAAFSGSLQKQPGAYIKAISELGGEDNNFITAGVLYHKQGNINGVSTRDTARSILNGDQILKENKSFKLQDEKELVNTFASKYSNAYRNAPDIYEKHYQAAKSHYTSLLVKNNGYSGELDDKLFKRAMKETGGDILKMSGSEIILPIGWDASTVEHRVIDTANALAQGGGISSKYAKDFGGNNLPRGVKLEQLSETRFSLMVGNSALTDNRGKRVVIDITKPLTFKREQIKSDFGTMSEMDNSNAHRYR